METEELAAKLEWWYAEMQGVDQSCPTSVVPIGILAEAISRLRELSQAQQWRPIETAPKGQKFLVAFDNGSVDFIDTDQHQFEWQPYAGPDPSGFIARPTHWLPLPPAPQGGA